MDLLALRRRISKVSANWFGERTEYEAPEKYPIIFAEVVRNLARRSSSLVGHQNAAGVGSQVSRQVIGESSPNPLATD